ncbi:DUF4181 domain-containing protein [Filibacter tadaridae]|uniref:DUF4181 domain-containing protein n=1 Tax=Filibacter tadaridae TaxID=2483811 RepID=A0A3P5X0E1_9BACL|nr:DUF4181 domain-containing protein [Filibacter tadaridae]VDC21667.1 hypothetical protein FILTAD_00671 [Filibacter tadaridae]
MFYYGVESSFWPKFFLFLFVLWLVMFLFSVIVRRVLKVEKKKMFSYNHLNERHKRIDWTIRIAIVVAMIVGVIINVSRLPLNPILFLEPYFLLFMLLFLAEIVTAVMEWKYAENRNAYIFTVLQLIFITILLLSIYTTDFFGLFGLR